MKKLSSDDRSVLIRLASSLPKGSEERKAILAGLKVARPGDETYREMNERFGDLMRWAIDKAEAAEAGRDLPTLKALEAFGHSAEFFAKQVRHPVEKALRRVQQEAGDEERRILDGIRKWWKEHSKDGRSGRLEDVRFNGNSQHPSGVTTIDAHDSKGSYRINILKGAVDISAINSLLADGRLKGKNERGSFWFYYRG